MRIRPAGPDDEAQVLHVIGEAFARDAVVDLWREVAPTAHSSLVAEVGGEVVGHVGNSRAWVDARRALVEVWMLSPLSVLEGHRERGIGTALVAAAVQAARDGGAPGLFVEGSPAYYGARGFEPASPHGFRPASVRTPDRAFQVALLEPWEEWMTGRLVYPDVWWRHDSAGLRDPALAELEERFGRSQ